MPAEPPPGHTLFGALSARTWVPAGFRSGQVPMITLCPIAAGLDPAGSRHGVDNADKEAVLAAEPATA